ncbi:MAG: GxxExxY protein [Betaproteobacteria bacterium]
MKALINHEEHEGHEGKTFRDCSEEVISVVVDAAIMVHRYLGPGLLESVYEQALAFELSQRGLGILCQVEVPAFYRGHDLGTGFRADMIVEDSLLLELKSVDAFSGVHLAQVITYLRLLGLKRGLLLNFNTRLLKEGIKRVSI